MQQQQQQQQQAYHRMSISLRDSSINLEASANSASLRGRSSFLLECQPPTGRPHPQEASSSSSSFSQAVVGQRAAGKPSTPLPQHHPYLTLMLSDGITSSPSAGDSKSDPTLADSGADSSPHLSNSNNLYSNSQSIVQGGSSAFEQTFANMSIGVNASPASPVRGSPPAPLTSSSQAVLLPLPSTATAAALTTSHGITSPVVVGVPQQGRTNLYISSLPRHTTDNELLLLFGQFGPIEKHTVARDAEGQCKGYGFVKFISAADAAAAIGRTHGAVFHGRTLQVKLADARANPPPSGSQNLATATTPSAPAMQVSLPSAPHGAWYTAAQPVQQQQQQHLWVPPQQVLHTTAGLQYSPYGSSGSADLFNPAEGVRYDTFSYGADPSATFGGHHTNAMQHPQPPSASFLHSFSNTAPPQPSAYHVAPAAVSHHHFAVHSGHPAFVSAVHDVSASASSAAAAFAVPLADPRAVHIGLPEASPYQEVPVSNAHHHVHHPHHRTVTSDDGYAAQQQNEVRYVRVRQARDSSQYFYAGVLE